MQTQKLEDQQILEYLKADSRIEQEKAIRALYRQHFDLIKHQVTNNSGSEQDAEDIFQDALIVIYNNVRKADFSLNAKLRTYLFSICRNLWLNKLRKGGRVVEINEEHEHIEIPENQMNALMEGERSKIIANLMDRLGKDCKTILLFFYFERMRIKKITQLMQYSSDQVTKNKKHRCMKKLKELAANSPVFK